jgi:DNA-binding SARP family transcriptional activator
MVEKVKNGALCEPSVAPMAGRGYGLRLFGGFELRHGSQVLNIPLSVQRLLGFLALHDRPLPRCYVAETLWPETGGSQAQANLRTLLWRLHPKHHDIVEVKPVELALSSAVLVDARALHKAARDYRRSGTLPTPETLLDIHGELLPGCWDCWLVFERERLRHEAVELLEAVSNACLARGEFHLATMLGLSAVECDPLRESANLLVVRSRLAAGDSAGAIRYALRYTRTIREELDLPPPPQFVDLLPTRHKHTSDDHALSLRRPKDVSLTCHPATHR